MENTTGKPRSSKRKKIVLILLALLLLAGAAGGYAYYKVVYTRVQMEGTESYLYIRNNDTYGDVFNQLTEKGFVKHPQLFDILAERANYPGNVKPGKYKITNDMNYIRLIRHLRSGKQEQVKLVINAMITPQELCSLVGTYLDADSIVLANMLKDTALLDSNGFNKENILCLFLPDTYNFYWNTSAEDFFKRMLREYAKFWNSDRRLKAAAQELSPVEVGILASIVDGESNKADERGIIAGLYLNRLRKGMLLQADPTVRYALRATNRQRFYEADTKFDSPYNTYIYTGLPPGPLALPSKQSINAVLNPSRHKYLYMCAKEDMSGYHNFTHDYNVHLLNAKRYRLALNKLGIR
ncbi:MAG TPA: endolytic transglycosylase MltG [Bacteroidia bacterium]|nr:endolytic transglycosylase MltG [Bacteroidia bacterium]